MWKNIFHLHEPSSDPVEIKDIGSSDEEEDRTQSVTMDVDDYEDLMKKDDKEEEMEEEAEEDKEEEDLVKIVVAVIASLPHSPPKMVTSTMEIASTGEIVSTTASSIALSSLISF